MNASTDGSVKEKDTYDPDAVLTIALDICESLLECGGETHRIEDTAERICRAYGAEKVEIFAMTSLIVATISTSDGKDFTQARRVYGSVNDLWRLEKLNALSRLICRDTPDPARVKMEISDIKTRRYRSAAWKYIGGFLGAFGFALFFGGRLRDALVAAVIGVFVCYFDSKRAKYLNQIAHTVIVSAVGSLVIALFCRATAGFLSIDAAVVNISVIMLLIPGMALGSAIRDLLCGEVISGAVRMMQSVLIAAAIAGGFTAILLLFDSQNVINPVQLDPLPAILYAGIGTVGFSLIFNVKPKWMVYAVLCGMLSWSAYLLASRIDPSYVSPVLFSSIAGGIACTLYAEVMARICKTPTTVFLIPGLIPLVPGSALYYTMAYLVQQDYGSASKKGIDTLMTCLGISIGIVFVSVVFQVIKNSVDAIKNKRAKFLLKKK